jgi:trimeric autotransporter adhesin
MLLANQQLTTRAALALIESISTFGEPVYASSTSSSCSSSSSTSSSSDVVLEEHWYAALRREGRTAAAARSSGRNAQATATRLSADVAGDVADPSYAYTSAEAVYCELLASEAAAAAAATAAASAAAAAGKKHRLSKSAASASKGVASQAAAGSLVRAAFRSVLARIRVTGGRKQAYADAGVIDVATDVAGRGKLALQAAFTAAEKHRLQWDFSTG